MKEAAQLPTPPELPGDPLPLPEDAALQAWFVVVAAFFLCLLLYLWKRSRLRETPLAALPPASIEPPQNQALEELQRLRAQSLPFGALYVRASEVLRTYVENRFLIPASKMTSEELLASPWREVQEKSRSTLGGFLGHCDLVKFARYVPSEEENRRLLDDAETFVRETSGG